MFPDTVLQRGPRRLSVTPAVSRPKPKKRAKKPPSAPLLSSISTTDGSTGNLTSCSSSSSLASSIEACSDQPRSDASEVYQMSDSAGMRGHVGSRDVSTSNARLSSSTQGLGPIMEEEVRMYTNIM
jgi:hypothetical protein